MRRFPKSSELVKLKKLTDARELAAMAELAVIETERKAAEIEFLALQNKNYEASSIEELMVIEKWGVWRKDELRRRSLAVATATAKHKTAAMRCGRFVAESAVLKEIASRAWAHEAKERQKRSS